jgi:ABC-type phosphate transport system auxiliary subunit
MNPGNPFSNNNQGNPHIQSFLESLKNRQQSPTEGASQMGGLEQVVEKRRLEESRRQEFFRSRQREANEVYSQTKSAQEKRIKEIQDRLKQLAVSVEKLNRQVVTTVQQEVVEYGVYQESFFDHIMNLINLLQKQVNDSGHWLAMFNARSKRKSYYWAMAGKGGTKFTQAADRGVATSIG